MAVAEAVNSATSKTCITKIGVSILCALPAFPGMNRRSNEQMFEIICDFCGEKLDLPGALIFSPPNDEGICVKKHMCVLCYAQSLESNSPQR